MGFFEGGDFGLAEVDSDGDSAGGVGEALGDGDCSVVVEAQSVDEGLVAWQAKHARLVVAGLGVPGDGADFDVAESEFVPLVKGDGVLVEASGEADSIWKMDSEQLDGVFFEGGGSAGNEALLDEVHRQVVRPLGVHSEREGAQERGV